MRAILHLDLDAFYASVEELDHPEWRGHPLIVGADPREGGGRGVVTTANYEARKFGVRSAMPISEAWRRCPNARFVRPRFSRYKEMSNAVFAILRDAAPVVEPASIDEAYIDASSVANEFGDAVSLARAIKARVKRETQLTISIGVATNKMVAKVASDRNKPDGLTVVVPGTEAEFLAPLPARVVPGVGPKTMERLSELGVATCADLAALAPSYLESEFGVWGQRLARAARGEDDSPVETSWERKSSGSERTFFRDESDPAVWEETVRAMAEDAVEPLERAGTLARTVTLKVRLTGFETHTRSRTLVQPTRDASVVGTVAVQLLREFAPPRAVRLLGVRLTGLAHEDAPGEQASLSDWPADVLGEADAWRPSQRRLDEL